MGITCQQPVVRPESMPSAEITSYNGTSGSFRRIHIYEYCVYRDLGGCLHLLKAVAGTGREEFRIERLRPINLAMNSGVEIALNMRQRLRAG